MIGADAILKSLENNNITEIYAYPGGTVIPIYDRMPQYNIRRILVRNEQGAAFAAQGFSRASNDKVGVCLATSGPGATNLVTGIADASMDSIPMVIITGNVFKSLIGTDGFQEIDIVGICYPIVKHSYFVEKADDLPRIVAEAFYIAKTGRPGPVLIDIPKCVQIEKISDKVWKKLKNKEEIELELPGYSYEITISHSEIDKAKDLIENSKRPVVIFGHGVIQSQTTKELENFLRMVQIPVTWTLHGIGGYDPRDELSLGMLGMHGTASANFAVHRADLVIAMGIRFDDRITGKLNEFQSGKKFIHLELDPSELQKNIIVDSKIAGDLKETLPVLIEKISPLIGQKFTEWRRILNEKKERWALDKSNDKDMTEIAVISELYKIITPMSNVVVDVGQHEMWAAQRFPYFAPKKFHASGGLGTMGFSLPVAIGVSFAGDTTWSISGDGGFQMNMQELGTIMQDNIPIKIIILNNSFLGMVRQWQELFYEKNYVDTPLSNPDFVKIGEAYGIPSFRAKTLSDTKDILLKMKEYNSGPILTEFVVEKEQNVFPMVPAGESLGNTMLDRKRRI